MVPYGLKTCYPVAPDLADIREFGLKSSVSRVRGPGGDIKNSFRRPAAKARIRRVYKRVERQAGERACRGEGW